MISNPKYCPQCGSGLENKMVAERVRPVCPACGFVFYINPIVAVGALIEYEGRVALVKRGVEPGRNLWGLPAGYAEADESAEEAAVRETWEETRLRVEIDGLLDACSFGRDQSPGVLLIYAAHVLSGQLEAGDDALDARWFGPDELPEIAFRTHRDVLRKWRQARSVTYRYATLVDVEVVAMLSATYSLQDGDYAYWVNDAERALCVAVDDGQIVGFSTVALDVHRQVAEIDQVFVHPRYRRWGIGTQLIGICVRFGVEMAVRAVQVRAPVSNPGWTVYLKAGFRIGGFTDDYYAAGSTVPEAALLLTYAL
jgi:ADP-ribose pyrophosphatase YjhB (NUDIX family)/ribosomal protein S18 acetylase RimI-like enzyme